MEGVEKTYYDFIPLSRHCPLFSSATFDKLVVKWKLY